PPRQPEGARTRVSSSHTRRSRSAWPPSRRSRAKWADRSPDPRVGLRDALFGKQKLAGPGRERLFALRTSAVALDPELGLRPAGAGGVVFKPLSSGDFVRAEND